MTRHKPKFVRKPGFTDREVQVLEALERYRSVRSAAKVLHVKEGAIRAALFRIRQRRYLSADFIDQYAAWKRKVPRGKYL